MTTTVTDPQNTVEVNPDGIFHINGWPVSFTYAHGKAGRLLQCNVFGFFIGYDGDRYLIISYSRPHVLDKGKVSKVMGRSIAAARMKCFIERYFAGTTHTEGLNAVTGMKGIRLYRITADEKDYSIKHADGTVEIFSAPEFEPVLISRQIWSNTRQQFSAARFESVKHITMAKLYRKMMKAISGSSVGSAL